MRAREEEKGEGGDAISLKFYGKLKATFMNDNNLYYVTEFKISFPFATHSSNINFNLNETF